jgi:hypothetical protein
MDPEEEWQIRSKVAELKKKKKKLMAAVRRKRKSLAKTQLEKKKVAAEEDMLRERLGPKRGMPPKSQSRRSRPKTQDKFAGVDPVVAQARVTKEIEAVEPEDIYPKDLEREFDKIDTPGEQADTEIVDLGKEATAGPDEEEEILDFSET